MAKSVGLNRSGGKRNLTIQLDEETIQQAKELAARRNTSVTGLVAAQIEQLVAADKRYRAAKKRAVDAMHNAEGLGGGGITWTRDELYEEMFDE